MHRPEPAQPHQLRNPARIVAIRLHRHGLERLAHMPRLQQLHGKPGRLHRRKQPLRQRPGLQPDPLKAEAKRTEPGDQRLRLAGHLASRKILPLASTTHTLEHSNDTSIPA
jgi:hypothetical protein